MMGTGFHKNMLKSAENAENNSGETKMLTKPDKLINVGIFKWQNIKEQFNLFTTSMFSILFCFFPK